MQVVWKATTGMSLLFISLYFEVNLSGIWMVLLWLQDAQNVLSDTHTVVPSDNSHFVDSQSIDGGKLTERYANGLPTFPEKLLAQTAIVLESDMSPPRPLLSLP